MENERWLPVDSRLGYEVSDHGRVRSYVKSGVGIGFHDKPKILIPNLSGRTPKQYRQVQLGRGNVRKVYHLVLEAFVGPRPLGTECRHLDGNSQNDRLDNLCWGTKIENTEDKIRHGTLIARKQFETIDFFDPFIPLEALIPFEIWKPFPKYTGYDVSNFGGVRSHLIQGTSKTRDIARVIKPTIYHNDRHPYPVVSIRVGNDKQRAFSIHRIVMETFNPRPYDGLVCRHLDGNPLNNHLSNLRWGTHAENMRDRIYHGTIRNGERCNFVKLSDDQVGEIRTRIENGEKMKDLGKEFGVSRAAISAIHTKRTHRIPTVFPGNNSDSQEPT